ncbi:MAG: CinA family protein [Bacteroidota bacterium]
MPLKTVEYCAKLLAKKKWSIAFAESATAGRIASEFAMTSVSGQILKGGIVCYDACIKEDILQVPHKLIREYTPESAEVTKELARRLKIFMPANVHLAVTGLTSPGGSETKEKPVGTVFISILINGRPIDVRSEFQGTPEKIISSAVLTAARVLITHLKQLEK